mmetsp:Transcript_5297/g.7798  ORF Transcript_5297/g.7798 Transcript_5297/m.7798 type:complete len:853 (-) Transcript_5297:7-2565(-)
MLLLYIFIYLVQVQAHKGHHHHHHSGHGNAAGHHGHHSSTENTKEEVGQHNSHCIVWLEKSLGLYIQPIALNNTEEDGNVGVCRFQLSEEWQIGTYARGPKRGEAKREVMCVTAEGKSTDEYQVAAKSHDCIVWWHEQAFNAFPLPLMTSFSATPGGVDGICKVKYGSDVIVGRLHGAEGTEYAKCEHYHNGERIMLEGGFALLGSYDRRRPYEATIGKNSLRPRIEVISEIEYYVRTYITYEDKMMLQRITGYSVEHLIQSLREESDITLMKFLSSDRWIYSELNIKGLHLLRCLLAERITDARRRDNDMHLHPDYEEFMKDGFLLKDFSKMTNEDLKDILQMVSGYHERHIPQLTWQLRVVEADICDLNRDLHVDTYQPSWKVWLYAEDIDPSQGPLSYVKGSHVNDEKKLRWLHEISNSPPVYGPGSYGSFRMDSVYCNTDISQQSFNETIWGYPKRTSIVGQKMTLVVADVSGLHARGMAIPGKLRRTFILSGGSEGASSGGLPRLNPFTYAKRKLSETRSRVVYKPTALSTERIPLHQPNLHDLANFIRSNLKKHFLDVKVTVTKSPDLSKYPWSLSSPGISGESPTIVDVGGEHHQVFDYANKLVFTLEELAESAGADEAYFLGAGAAPRSSVGCNGELIPIDNIYTNVRRSQLATVKINAMGVAESSALTPYNSSEMGFLANLLMTEGKTGEVLEIHVSKRISNDPVCESFTECIRQVVAKEFENESLLPIGFGGVFRVNKGKVKTHVMADTGGKTLTAEEVQEHLKIFEIGPDLTAATVFLTKSPKNVNMKKKVRLEHTHLYNDQKTKGGHYHGDTTPKEISYTGYFTLAKSLFLVDRDMIKAN